MKKNKTMPIILILFISSIVFVISVIIIDGVLAKESYAQIFSSEISNKFPIREARAYLLGGVVSLVFGLIMLSAMIKPTKNNRTGEEYGSGRLNTLSGNKRYTDYEKKGLFKKIETTNNIILSKNLRMRLTGYARSPKNNRNSNVLTTGDSGSGKTRFYMKPNILQANASFIITDPKGTLLNEIGFFLLKMGYKLRVLNLKDTESIRKYSMGYNPFAYLKSELDIMIFIDTLIKNTSGSGEQSKEDFWIKAERLLLLAYVSYVLFELPKEDQNMGSVLKLVRNSVVSEEEQNKVDILFQELKRTGSTHIIDGKAVHIKGDDLFSVQQYDMFKNAGGGKTAQSIVISVSARLTPFAIKDIRDLMSKDEMKFEKIGIEKTALFLITSDSQRTLDFISSIFYTQIFNILYTVADNEHRGKYELPIRFLLDEFANIGVIPGFEDILSTCRSRNISITIIVQMIAQLKKNYKDGANIIIGNCNSQILLGAGDPETLEAWSKKTGKSTIKMKTISESKQGSSKSTQTLGREVKTTDEIETMDGGNCLVQIRGSRIWEDEKYPLEEHPNYKYTADYNDKLYFDISKYITRKKSLMAKKKLSKKNTTPTINREEKKEMYVVG